MINSNIIIKTFIKKITKSKPHRRNISKIDQSQNQTTHEKKNSWVSKRLVSWINVLLLRRSNKVLAEIGPEHYLLILTIELL